MIVDGKHSWCLVSSNLLITPRTKWTHERVDLAIVFFFSNLNKMYKNQWRFVFNCEKWWRKTLPVRGFYRCIPNIMIAWCFFSRILGHQTIYWRSGTRSHLLLYGQFAARRDFSGRKETDVSQCFRKNSTTHPVEMGRRTSRKTVQRINS